MKVLLDQGLPRSTVDFLQLAGVEAEHVGDLGMATATDEEILDNAAARDAIVVTLDSDFHGILARRSTRTPSVVRIRIEGLKGDAVAAIITQVLASVVDDLLQGAAVSVTSSSIRVRRLPLAVAAPDSD